MAVEKVRKDGGLKKKSDFWREKRKEKDNREGQMKRRRALGPRVCFWFWGGTLLIEENLAELL